MIFSVLDTDVFKPIRITSKCGTYKACPVHALVLFDTLLKTLYVNQLVNVLLGYFKSSDCSIIFQKW